MSGGTTVSLTALLNARPVGGFQILTIVLCALLVFAEGYDAQAIAYAAPAISSALGIGKGALVPVFGAGLTGIMLGSLILSPLSDRLGRRGVILLSTLAFALLSIATVFAHDATSLTIIRLLTGIGIGGAMPNAIALTSEFSPTAKRPLLVILMFCGFSLGSAIGGIIAVSLIPHFGWQAVFWFGGLMPLALMPFLYFMLPESVTFLAARDGADPRALKLLARIAPDAPPASRVLLDEEKTSRGSVLELLAHGRLLMTTLVWIVFFMSLLDLNLIVAWLPTTLATSGANMSAAVFAGSMFQFGGIAGSIVVGFSAQRIGLGRIMAVAYVIAAVSIWLVAATHDGSLATMLAVAGAGVGVVGGQCGANALAAAYYPTTIRSTGVGWAFGIGRVGSIVGPVVGGTLLAMKMPPQQLFLLCIVPILIAALASAIVQYRINRTPLA